MKLLMTSDLALLLHLRTRGYLEAVEEAGFSKGVIHKPCGLGRERGVCQKSILLHKPYLIT